MKSYSRGVFAVILATALSIQFAPLAGAATRAERDERDERDSIATRIIRIVSKLQRFIGLTPNSTEPMPPRP